MSAKQDRQGVRTASQLEQKWKFGESFAKAYGMAEDAQNAAEEAKKLLEQGMTQEQVFNILTNNGQSQGLYRGENGELFINASYIKSGELIADLIKSGVLQSVDGRTKFNLETGELVCTTSIDSAVAIKDGTFVMLDSDGKSLMAMYPMDSGSVYFFNPQTSAIVGSIVGSQNGLTINCTAINPGKKVLFYGNVAAGSTFTVPNTANYDLFAVKLGGSTNTENTVVLAYKNGNTINGVGGWAGTSTLAKQLFFLSATFNGDTWTLVDARKQGIYNSGSIESGTALNIKEVVGVI